MRRVGLVIALVMLAAPAQAAGPYSTAFLPPAGGARAFALGGTTAALAEDASAVFLNPARLAFLSRPGATAGYANVAEGISSSNVEVAYAQPLGEDIAAPRQKGGAHRYALGVGIEYQSLTLSEGSSYGEGAASLSGALAPINFVSLGVTVRGLRSFTDVAGLTANGYAVDAGISMAAWPTIEVALVGHNVAGSVSYEERSDEQPLRTMTFSVALMRHAWLAGEAGVTIEPDDGVVYHAGAEARPIALLALRGGMRHRVRPESRTTPSAGIGIVAGAFALDYGVRLGGDDDLGIVHRVTVGWSR